MTTAESVRFDGDRMWVGLANGRALGVLSWFPRLDAACPEARAAFKVSPYGIHWERLGQNVLVERSLAVRRDMRRAKE